MAEKIGSGGAQKTNYTKHYALATAKQNKQGVVPGGKPVGGGKGCCNGR